MFFIHILRVWTIIRTINKKGGFYILVKKLPKPIFWLLLVFVRRNTKDSPGKILRSIFYDLGPVFIKLGQALSTRIDLVGEEMARELALLQDRLPITKELYVAKTITKELGKPVEELFSSFDHKAVASASIAEVFKAKNLDGKDVAVKILKPRIRKIFKREVAFFRWGAEVLDNYFKIAKRLKPHEVVDTFENYMKSELDLRLEAAAAMKFSEIHQNDKHIHVPEVYWDLTSEDVLTLEWIDGIKISELNELKKHKYDLTKLAENFVLMFFKQAFEVGMFHADLHSGNILVNKKQQIVLLDFGIVGHLDINSRVYIAEILNGFAKKDYDYVAKVHFEAGYIPRNQSFFLFSQACRAIGEPIVGQSSDKISIGNFFAQLLKVTRDFKMEVQPQLLLLQKTIVMTEGLAVHLSPKINLWKVTEPFVREWGKIHLALDAKIVRRIFNVIKKLEDLPTSGNKTSVYIKKRKSPWVIITLFGIIILLLIK
ncbi:MAG: 2-polyprenylphenol 6-hydroxylase [Rickettsiales bacterium]